jgi:hypothetical protein
VAKISNEIIIMKNYHVIESVTIENGKLKLIVDGIAVEKSLQAISPMLAMAKPELLQIFEISPSGYGIHWPLLDEDISIDGLLGIIHQLKTIQTV